MNMIEALEAAMVIEVSICINGYIDTDIVDILHVQEGPEGVELTTENRYILIPNTASYDSEKRRIRIGDGVSITIPERF